MPKVFQSSGNIVAEVPEDKSYVNLYIDGDGMFCCRMNDIEYYTREGKFSWKYFHPGTYLLIHEKGGFLQAVTPYGTTVDAMWKSAYKTKFSRYRGVNMEWDNPGDIGPVQYHQSSLPVTYDDVFFSESGELMYRSQNMYLWDSKPSEVVYNMSSNKIKTISGLENPRHARPFGENERILDDSCWVGNAVSNSLFWARPAIKSGMLEVAPPSKEYDLNPAHETHSTSRPKSFM